MLLLQILHNSVRKWSKTNFIFQMLFYLLALALLVNNMGQKRSNTVVLQYPDFWILMHQKACFRYLDSTIYGCKKSDIEVCSTNDSISGHLKYALFWYPDMLKYLDTRYPDFWTSRNQLWLNIRSLETWVPL